MDFHQIAVQSGSDNSSLFSNGWSLFLISHSLYAIIDAQVILPERRGGQRTNKLVSLQLMSL